MRSTCPLDSDDWTTQVAKIAAAKPDFVFNTINGSSNVGFIKAYYEAGLGAGQLADHLGVDRRGRGAGHGRRPHRSVRRLELLPERREPGERRRSSRPSRPSTATDRPTSDPMEAAYTSLYLYKAMVEKAESFCVDAVNAASDGVTFDAPEGTVTVNGENHHIAKTGLIGQINADNQFDIVWSSEEPDRARSRSSRATTGGTRTRS